MLRRIVGGELASDAVDEDSSSVGSDWTQVSINSNVHLSQVASIERRESLSSTHSAEFARVDSEEQSDMSTDEEENGDILVVDRMENVLADGTQYTVDTSQVAGLLDALSDSFHHPISCNTDDDTIAEPNSHTDEQKPRSTVNPSTAIAAVVVVAVICGFGIGHFAGIQLNQHQLVQQDQLQQLKQLKKELSSCAHRIVEKEGSLRSEIIDCRKKYSACQLAEHTCSVKERPSREAACAKPTPNSERHIELRAMEANVQRMQREVKMLRAELRSCEQGARKSIIVWSAEPMAGNDTAVWSNDARREAGRASAASLNTQVRDLAITTLWNEPTSKLDVQTFRTIAHSHLRQVVAKRAGHLKRISANLPPLLTCEQDEWDDYEEMDLTNFTLPPPPPPRTLKPLTRSDVYNFRRLIKRSPLRTVIGSMSTKKFLAKLKPLTGKHEQPYTDEQRRWLTCQQLWWTNSHYPQCNADELAPWQTSQRSTFRELIALPWIADAVSEWTNRTAASPCTYDDDAACQPSHLSAWLFTRAQQRTIARIQQERSDWLSERYRQRALQRSDAQKADWLFERHQHRHAQRLKQQQRPS